MLMKWSCRGQRFRLHIFAALSFSALLLVSSSNPGWSQAMTLPGQFSVGPTGAATYRIPIAVPPGTAGMAPSLSLDYSSQNGNGLLGMGWTLSGLPSIGRCPQTMAQDGVIGGINFNSYDRFCLEGQRLVAISGSYGADGAEYRTEIDSYSRILSHGAAGTGPAWFEVHTKSGQVMEFGHTADSQILAQGKTTARSWAVDKVSDSKANYFTVTYVNDATNGQAYPSRVDYTGNAAANLATYNSVQFVYATRPDITPQYQAGSLSQTTVRLTDAKTYAGATLVADYQLAYQQGAVTSRSRLTSITLCSGGGNCLPPDTFAWTEVLQSFAPPQNWLAGGAFAPSTGWTDMNTLPRFFQDVNGDGLPDIVGIYNSCVYVALNTGAGFPQVECWVAGGAFAPSTGWTDMNTFPRFLQDVNGDGLPDLVGIYNSCVYVSLNTGSGFPLDAACWVSGGAFAPSTGWTDMNTFPRFLQDVNGDGLPDIVGIYNSCVYVSLNTGSGFPLDAACWVSGGAFAPSTGWTDMNTFPRFLQDVNGDGLPDIVGLYNNCIYVSLNTGSGFPLDAACWLAGGAFAPSTGWTDMNTFPRFLQDVNGDGLPDIVGLYNSCIYVSINTGVGFRSAACWLTGGAFAPSTGWTDMNTMPRFLADVNGDGLPDIVGLYNNCVYVSINTGSSFKSAACWLSGGAFTNTTGPWPGNNTTPRTLVDVLGTGRAGILGVNNQGIFVAPSGNGSPAPDLLVSVTTGLGATTLVTYAPATNPSVVTRGTSTAFPTINLVGPLYVVSRVDATNGVGGNYSSTYTYSGGRLDTRGRGFLGFAQTSTTDLQTKVVQTTTYGQSFPYIGLMGTTTKTLNTLTLNQTANSYQFSNASGAATLSMPTQTSAPYRVSVAQSVSSSSDLDGSKIPTATTSYQYDAYGNATQVVVSTPDGFSKTTANSFTNDTTNWLLGRLTAASVTSVSP